MAVEQAAGLWAALTCTHVATPDCSILYLRQRWSWASMSVETASLLSRAWQHSVLAAMADGDICGHISMSQADVPAAMAAVLASIPAIAAGRTSYCVPDDEVRVLPFTALHSSACPGTFVHPWLCFSC